MTTVAFDGEAMSCDTMMSDGGIKLYIETKMIKNSEFVLGWAGSVGVARRVLTGIAALDLSELLVSGIKGQEDLESRVDIILVCRETKQIFDLVGNNFISIRADRHAIGSGADVAIGVEESYKGIAAKINRGTFSFAFFMQCMKALNQKIVRLEE